MTWERKTKYSIRTAEGYAIASFYVGPESRPIYVAWPPLSERAIYRGGDLRAAKSACEGHLSGVANGDK